MLLTKTQVLELRKTFENNSSTCIKLLWTQLLKIAQSGGSLDRILGPLLKTWLPVMKIVLKTLTKRFLIPLGLTGAHQQ